MQLLVVDQLTVPDLEIEDEPTSNRPVDDGTRTPHDLAHSAPNVTSVVTTERREGDYLLTDEIGDTPMHQQIQPGEWQFRAGA